MARMTKKEKTLQSIRADFIAQNACYRIVVNMMDLGKISAKAAECVAAGMTDDQALEATRAFCLTIGKAS